VQHHALPWPADGGVRSMPRMCTVVTLQSPQLGALRVMTTHLEYYSAPQRLAQALSVRALHDEQCAMAAAPPEPSDDGSPFQTKLHTPHAVLCGDFNADASDAAIDAITAASSSNAAHGLRNAWPLLHGSAPHAPTFRVFDRTYGAEPMACDFVFVSGGLAPRVRRVEVDLQTRASDHQPVVVEFG
jgi:endonuclease/exonuclease/phosphatase family metal-dependent hydrolase